MDEARIRELRLEEQFPDGKVNSGFDYMLQLISDPPNTVLCEIRMSNGDTLRLFFPYSVFLEFASVVNVVKRSIEWQT